MFFFGNKHYIHALFDRETMEDIYDYSRIFLLLFFICLSQAKMTCHFVKNSYFFNMQTLKIIVFLLKNYLSISCMNELNNRLKFVLNTGVTNLFYKYLRFGFTGQLNNSEISQCRRSVIS